MPGYRYCIGIEPAFRNTRAHGQPSERKDVRTSVEVNAGGPGGPYLHCYTRRHPLDAVRT